MTTSPFPGMDPYLEAPEIWADLHDTLITIFREQLIPKLIPKYMAEVQSEIVIEHLESDGNTQPSAKRSNGHPVKKKKDGTGLKVPDVTVLSSQPATLNVTTDVTLLQEQTAVIAPLQLLLPESVERRLTHIRILRRSNAKLVTVIKVLSPINKRSGEKREEYLLKRRRYLESEVHLIEIDLLRRWERMPMALDPPTCDYMILVSDADKRPVADVWPLTVRNPLPIIPVPLLRGDPPAMLDIGDALRTAYSRARYDLRIDYTKSAQPPLLPQDAEWAKALVRCSG